MRRIPTYVIVGVAVWCVALFLFSRMDLSPRPPKPRPRSTPTPTPPFNTKPPVAFRDATVRRRAPGVYEVVVGFLDASSAPTAALGDCNVHIATVRMEWKEPLGAFVRETKPLAGGGHRVKLQDFFEDTLGPPQAPHTAFVTKVFDFSAPYPPAPSTRGNASLDCFGRGWDHIYLDWDFDF